MKLSFTKSYIITLILLLINSIVLILALAYPPNPKRIIETWLVFIIVHRFLPRWWRALMWISAIVILLYHSTAAHYGRPSFGIVASLISTNTSEACEYLTSLSWQTCLFTLLLTIIPLFILRWSRHQPQPQWKSWWAIPILLALLIMSIQTARKGYTVGGFALRAQPIEFLADAYLQPRAYFAELKKLKEDVNKPDQWKIDHVQNKYQNYVLVIGESARADYFHLYHFKYPNTPFLDTHASIIMDNMYSAGPNTPISLLHGLCLSHGETFSIQNNIITLAKKAGLQTLWLSNQGALVQYDTSISTLAHQANHTIFLKKTSYDFGDEIFDTQLLAPLKEVLKQPLSSQQPRLIVMHTMGSHPNPCNRLKKPPQHYVENNNSNCYIDSIKQTDNLLQQIYSILQTTGQSFSIIYFSDHGLSHDKDTYEKNSIVRASSILRHNDRFIENYHVPFVVINSDQNSSQRISARRSGFELIDGIAQWLGIGSPQLPYGEQFFSDIDSKKLEVLNMSQKLQSLQQLEHDPLPKDLR